MLMQRAAGTLPRQPVSSPPFLVESSFEAALKHNGRPFLRRSDSAFRVSEGYGAPACNLCLFAAGERTNADAEQFRAGTCATDVDCGLTGAAHSALDAVGVVNIRERADLNKERSVRCDW